MKNYFKITKRLVPSPSEGGFTLIEALVAVFMLSVAIAATIGLIQSSLAANSYAQAQVTANYLGGEAIEYIRNIRDTNFLKNQNWQTGILNSCFSTGCDVDTIHGGFLTCSGDCEPLQFNPDLTDGFFHHVAASESMYTRTINIENINAHEMAVRVTIKGASGYFKRTPLVIVEHMFDWYQEPAS